MQSRVRQRRAAGRACAPAAFGPPDVERLLTALLLAGVVTLSRPLRAQGRAEARPTAGPSADDTRTRVSHTACSGCHLFDPAAAATAPQSQSAPCLKCHVDDPQSGHFYAKGHPVRRRYPDNLIDFRPRETVEQAGLLLPNGQVECTTCHDPHTKEADVRGGRPKRDSGLCVTCHVK